MLVSYPYMNDVQFNEPEITRTVSASPKETAMTRLFMKFGIAKDYKGAQRAGLVVAIIAIAITAYIIIPHGGSAPANDVPLMPGEVPAP